MCGLVGHVVPREIRVNREAVTQGSLAIAHRGPDGNEQVDLEQCSLAHRRLSVIDPEGSPQPWRSRCGRYYLVFNGEIYNYPELRSELEGRGHQFRSRGDTEVLMNLYIEFGTSCLQKLNGMFAFAIWDEQDKALFMARDRLGEKPLYYAESGGQLGFASELAGLMPFTFVDLTMNRQALHDYFAHQFIGRDQSIYTGIQKLPPAHSLTWKDGNTKVQRYWQPDFTASQTKTCGDRCEEFRDLLDDAVHIRLRSDVPLGMFLSGGMDSSLIAASMHKQGYEVSAFTIGFTDPSYDEQDRARWFAQQLGIKHRVTNVDLNDMDQIDRVIDAFEEPYADPSAIPTWTLCHFARDEVTVALSGDGVDELFAGYRRYYAQALLARLPFSPNRLNHPLLNTLIGKLPEPSSYYGGSLAKKIRLFHRMILQIAESPKDPLPQTFRLSERQSLLGEGSRPAPSFDLVSELDLERLDPVSRMLAADLMTYLPDDILVKVDRMSMRHGLEVRCPFLDHRLVEFATSLPWDCKIYSGKQKYLLKTCYHEQLPKTILKGRKHGFAVPLGRWFRENLHQAFQELVLNNNHLETILDQQVIAGLWQQHQKGYVDHGFKLWSLYVFARWLSRYTET